MASITCWPSGWVRTDSVLLSITCVQGRLEHVTAYNQTGPSGPHLQQQPHRPSDPRGLLGTGGHVKPENVAGDVYCPDAGRRVFEHVHLDDPEPDSQCDPHDRAGGY